MVRPDWFLAMVLNLHQVLNHFHLQTDLDLIVKWTETWQMNLKIDKCAILTCSRLLSSSTSVYTINGKFLTRVTQHPYLGVMFDSSISFSPHISNITCHAMRIFKFVKRNLYKCDRDTKCMAYASIVRPVLETKTKTKTKNISEI